MNGAQGGAMPEGPGPIGGNNSTFANKAPQPSGLGPQEIDPLVRSDRAISSQLPPKVEASNG